jgi:PAS domain S-box-containing protein
MYSFPSVDEELRLLKISVERSSDEVFWLDFEGNILYANEAATTITGYSHEELCSMKIEELDTEIPPGAWEASVADLRERKTQFITSRHQCKDGKFIDVDILAVYVNLGDREFSFAFVRDITDRKQSQKALEHAKKKLNLLNYITINDIQNQVFTLTGYQQILKDTVTDSKISPVIDKQLDILRKITHSLKFVQSFQDLGLRPPTWQNANHVFLMAISHLDFLNIRRTVRLDKLEIFADPLLEQVFFILADNILTHGKTVTQVTLGHTGQPGSLILFFEDDGMGIPEESKDRIFSPDFQQKTGIGLFLAREILEITGISIQETGTPGKGARFEMVIPEGVYRFS